MASARAAAIAEVHVAKFPDISAANPRLHLFRGKSSPSLGSGKEIGIDRKHVRFQIF
jgi:hypothetical protein